MAIAIHACRYPPPTTDTPGFGHQAWFAQLFDYGLPPQAGQSAQHAHDDVDQHLVPALVAKVVLPVVLQRVRDCWSPTSVRQSRGVAVALEDLAVFDLANQPAMQVRTCGLIMWFDHVVVHVASFVFSVYTMHWH